MDSGPDLLARTTICGLSITLFEKGKRELDLYRRVFGTVEAPQSPRIEIIVQEKVDSDDSLIEPGFNIKVSPLNSSPEERDSYEIHLDRRRYEELVDKGWLLPGLIMTC